MNSRSADFKIIFNIVQYPVYICAVGKFLNITYVCSDDVIVTFFTLEMSS